MLHTNNICVVESLQENKINSSILTSLYEQIKIEKTLNQYKKVLYELKQRFTTSINDWELVC